MRLFKSIDHNKDDVISNAELKEHQCNIKFGPAPSDADEKVDRIIKQFDASGGEMISVEEFVTGFSQCLHDEGHHSHLSLESKDEIYQKNWEMTEKLLQKETDRSAIAWIKAILLLVIGIVILGLLAEPLSKSVGSFSRTINVPSFFISFILVPLATNAIIAISAINEASRNKQRTNSLTLSEVCTTVLSSSSFSLSTSFPVWISAMAFLLYPFSSVLVYVLDYDFFV
ncbi:sodium/calcium exchanger NCL1-like [Solanum dulcamara]|uniref:sodium/calcium exchanger NCL1-like n=1 Tax=Solanum dulcamara TaxID=45834 RepID=UPI002485D09E|nr:sodium/calcium exchanger NCL1-like [Solanum dulcamara]